MTGTERVRLGRMKAEQRRRRPKQQGHAGPTGTNRMLTCGHAMFVVLSHPQLVPYAIRCADCKATVRLKPVRS